MAQSQRTKPEAASSTNPPPQKRKAAPRAAEGYEETVTVACKLPNGLILRVFDMRPQDEHVMGGGVRKSHVAVEREERVTLFGFSHPQNAAPRCRIANGYALTPNVPKDFFDEWMKQNAKSDLVKNHLIYAHEEEASAIDYAKEHAELRSGR